MGGILVDVLSAYLLFIGLLGEPSAAQATATVEQSSNNIAASVVNTQTADTAIPDLRIVSLSPHLTELVFAIGRGKQLVATSDYSDYPAQAANLPSVASYQGANIAEIIRLKPTHVLVWRGGNKDSDIQKLSLLGFDIFESRIDSLANLQNEIIELGRRLNAKAEANKVAESIAQQLSLLTSTYKGQSKEVVYYMSTQPFIGLGSDPWLNDVLMSCGLKNIYADALGTYPALQISDVLRQQPDLVIAAGKYTMPQVTAFWQNHSEVFSPQFVIANPDALHRFTPRSVQEIAKVCALAYQNN